MGPPRYLRTTPINVLLAESGQTPMVDRVELLTLREVIKAKYYRDPNLKFIRNNKVDHQTDPGTYIAEIAEEHVEIISQKKAQS